MKNYVLMLLLLVASVFSATMEVTAQPRTPQKSSTYTLETEVGVTPKVTTVVPEKKVEVTFPMPNVNAILRFYSGEKQYQKALMMVTKKRTNYVELKAGFSTTYKNKRYESYGFDPTYIVMNMGERSYLYKQDRQNVEELIL